jgi:ribosomal protein S20
MQAVDKAAKHHTIHPNKAARIKSRRTRQLQRSRQ